MTTNNHRNYAGCWTCRLRHKKCDKLLPVCGCCGALEICCYSDLPKPEWMDNGAKQREMAQRVRNEVKRSAIRRRSKKLMQRIAQDLDGEEEARTPAAGLETGSSHPVGEMDGSTPNEEPSWRPESSNNVIPEFNTASVTSDYPAAGSPQVALDYLTPPDSHRLSQRVDNEAELTSVMVYLDYVFPALFPFYKPTLLDGGRNWLLVSPIKIKALYHTAISLTSYFLSAVPICSSLAYQACTSIAWDEQCKQTGLAVKMVQRDLQIINSQGVHCDLLESVYLLESIVQLLIFEGTVAKNEDWRMHFDAAIVLFEQIVQPTGTIASLLNLMGQTLSFPKSDGVSFLTTDQAAFRFFSAILLVADVTSSTALVQPPRLRKYHGGLLSNNLDFGRDAALQLEEFIGCQNWVLLLIGEIAALDAWKKNMKIRRTLAMTQLMKRAAVIEQELQDGLSRLNSDSHTQWSKPVKQFDMFAPMNSSNHHHSGPLNTTKTVTRIWAYAARMYLQIVLSGWQIATPEIRDDVAKTIELFSRLPSSASLRALAWPFCVAGCLAEEDQESKFRGIISSIGPLGMLGTMKEALRIMENVWRNRNQMDSDTWDIAACLRGTGHIVLFI
ncbi:fungal-specific transcription factor domain-containing protein [Aspergillus cavernicola]|uniref:Fungal-specific transcription factor domain-containing protein n=1 Tax=Aspergillus cavernicola TaxID=176166 RepID=A0ABR4IXI6_9EURO